MILYKQTKIAGFILSALLLSACGSDSNMTEAADSATDGADSQTPASPDGEGGAPSDIDSINSPEGTDQGESPATESGSSEVQAGETEADTDGENSDDTADEPDSSEESGETDSDAESDAETETTEQETQDGDNNDDSDAEDDSENSLPDAIATGADFSGSLDDSPTATESLSVQAGGAFIKDSSREEAAPSAPTGLTLLLSAEDWLEFTWAPSTDDEGVAEYEIYRDGVSVYKLRGDTGFDLDFKSWVTTSYIDCNYTHYVHCVGDQPAVGGSHAYSVAAIDGEGNRSALSDEVVFELQTPRSSGPDLTGYSLVLDEEFDSNKLDRDLWKTSLPWGENAIINSEQQFFVNVFGADPIEYSPFEFNGSTMTINGTETPPELLSSANNQPYLSGVITTKDYFKMTYGYVEMRAKVASGDGILSTFFLFNDGYNKNEPEIDILEYIGSRPDKAYQTYHYYDSIRVRSGSNKGEKHSSPTMESVADQDLSADFHTYSVLWEPGLMVWYIDEVEVRRIAGPRVSDEPMNIIAQLVVGSEWIGSPDPATLPVQYEIDYIKAWQKLP